MAKDPQMRKVNLTINNPSEMGFFQTFKRNFVIPIGRVQESGAVNVNSNLIHLAFRKDGFVTVAQDILGPSMVTVLVIGSDVHNPQLSAKGTLRVEKCFRDFQGDHLLSFIITTAKNIKLLKS